MKNISTQKTATRNPVTTWQLNEAYPDARPSERLQLIHAFIDSTDEDSFEERFQALVEPLQALLVEHVRENIEKLDRMVDVHVENGAYSDGWKALRTWVRRQPWGEPRRRGVPVSEVQSWKGRLREQGALLGRLEVERMRATTDAERSEITLQITELQARFERENHG